MKNVVFTISLFMLACNIFALDKNDFCFIDSNTGEKTFVDELISEIKKKMPEISEIELINQAENGLTLYHLKYNGVKFGYYKHDEIAYVIFICSNRYFTNRNITIGNDRYDVLNTYGDANYSNNEWLSYSIKAESDRPWLDEEYGLWFHFNDQNKVDEIIIQHL
jgi:hypothetical protein